MDKKSKTQRINDRLEEARQAAEIGKLVAPDKIDRHIDRAVQTIEVAQTGLGLFERIRSIFRKKAK